MDIFQYFGYWIIAVILIVLTIVSLTLIHRKRFKTALALATVTLIVAILFSISCITDLNKSSGWLLKLENQIFKQHPSVTSMEVYPKFPFLRIYCYTKNMDKLEVSNEFEQIRNFIQSKEGRAEITAAYGYNCSEYYGISINFLLPGSDISSISYLWSRDNNSDEAGSVGFENWQETDYSESK
jgi:hypothetical protein